MVLAAIWFATACSGRLIRHLGGGEGPALDGRQVALIRLDLLGDVVMSLVGARAIKQRFPDAHVTMVTLPQTAAAAHASPDVDRVVAVDTNLVRSPLTLLRPETLAHLINALRELRARRFDLTISLHGRTASLLALVTRSRRRIGFAGDAYPSALDEPRPGGRQSHARLRLHDTDHTLALIPTLPNGAQTDVPAPPLTVAPEAVRQVKILLDGHGIAPDGPLVVFHVGSGYGDFKRWPAASFAELAQRLSQSGAQIAVLGAASEAQLVESVTAVAPAVSLAGETTFDQLLALLQRADLLISGDSGPLHLGAALGVPVIGVYGPTDPLVNGPKAWRGQPVEVLRRDIACSPCYSVRVRAECPLGDPICMRLVGPAEVFERAMGMLRMSGKAGRAGHVRGPA